ncbi:MAG: alpha/beta hydrolase [Alphaproteobacteria bacterium]|nr:alpha/beta hydrolase [Alphaproteobacteria bacterium]
MRRLRIALLGLLLAWSVPAEAAGLIERMVRLPVSFGAAGTLALKALIVRPDDDRRHPLAVLTHGKPGDPREHATMSPRTMRAQAREFARRGWVTVAFMRRGYGQSEGRMAEGAGPCSAPEYEKAGRNSAEDVRAVIQAMRNDPHVDDSKVISVGRSAGGLAAVALTADPPPGLVAAINFAGGRGRIAPDEVCAPERLVNAFGAFGRTSRVPMLWIYAENDHYFGPALAKRLHAAFTKAGGRAEFILAPPFGTDGHALFSAPRAWTAHVDDFLARRGLATAGPLIPLRDEASVVYPKGLGVAGREAFLRYLEANDHKAFAISPKGAFGWRSGRKTVAAAAQDALAACLRHAPTCSVAMTDE